MILMSLFCRATTEDGKCMDSFISLVDLRLPTTNVKNSTGLYIKITFLVFVLQVLRTKAGILLRFGILEL